MKLTKHTIATLAGHSALDIFAGAKKYGFSTVAVVEKGREKTYTRYFKNLVDEIINVAKFSDLTDPPTIYRLKKLNSIFIPHRYIQVYCDLHKFENNFSVPVFGNRNLLLFEEREGIKNQYTLLSKAGVNYPKQYKSYKNIDRLVIVKVKEAVRRWERAFFFAATAEEFNLQAQKLIDGGKIKRHDLENAVIEEYIVGTQVNFNFFYSPIKKRLELIGTDARRQTNIDGLIRLPADEQEKVLQYLDPSYVETGHIAVTVKESLLEKAFMAAEKILKAAKAISPPGIIGPFALQTAVTAGPPKEKIIVFDISLRIPGSPGTGFTPYSGYLYGKSVSFGERIAIEIKNAIKSKAIKNVIT